MRVRSTRDGSRSSQAMRTSFDSAVTRSPVLRRCRCSSSSRIRNACSPSATASSDRRGGSPSSPFRRRRRGRRPRRSPWPAGAISIRTRSSSGWRARPGSRSPRSVTRTSSRTHAPPACRTAWSHCSRTARRSASSCSRVDKVQRVATGQLTDEQVEGRNAYAGVLRFYELAKRQEWQVRDLPWDELPPIPEGKGSPERRARRKDMWRSVLTQQLQADMLACDMSSQLLNIAPDPEAKLYYSTMVQDESRHTEAWLKLIAEAGGTAERDPYLDELAHMTLEADTVEEKVFQMQVFYERLIISRFRMIARASRGTVLEDLCNRLTVDDGIHHGAGMAYEKVLLQNASKKTKQKLVDAANRLLPIFVQHALWRPKERAMIGGAMRSRDQERLREDLEIGVRLAESRGLGGSDVQLPVQSTRLR